MLAREEDVVGASFRHPGQVSVNKWLNLLQRSVPQPIRSPLGAVPRRRLEALVIDYQGVQLVGAPSDG